MFVFLWNYLKWKKKITILIAIQRIARFPIKVAVKPLPRPLTPNCLVCKRSFDAQNTGNYISKLLGFIFFLWEHNHGPLAERGITIPFPGTVNSYIIGSSLWKNFIVVSLRTVTMSFFRNPNSSSSCLSKSNRAFALLRRFLRKKGAKNVTIPWHPTYKEISSKRFYLCRQYTLRSILYHTLRVTTLSNRFVTNL